MPLDFRYHLASLAAVFGALIIGILLGVAMKEGPALSNQVQDLRKEFSRSESLRNIDKNADQFNLRTQELLVRYRLQGRNIALVSNAVPESADLISPLHDTLTLAGATVTTQILIKPGMHTLTTDKIFAVYQAMGVSDPPAKPVPGDLLRRVARSIGHDSAGAIDVLRQKKLIKVMGNPAQPVSAIIFLGGVTDTANYVSDLDVPFLRGCLDSGTTVVATEPFDAPQSAMKSYQDVVPFTIDNIDRVAGRSALVLALAAGQHGHFGYKPTADDVAPESTP